MRGNLASGLQEKTCEEGPDRWQCEETRKLADEGSVGDRADRGCRYGAETAAISAEDFADSLDGLVEELGGVNERVAKCVEETDFETLGSTLDGLAGSAQSLGAFRLGRC